MGPGALSVVLVTFGLCSAWYEDSYDDCYDDYYDDYYDECYDGQFMSDPDSCCHYYVCDHGQPVRFSCGEGTYYNPDVKTCDHRWNVDCGTRSTKGCGGHNDDYGNNDWDNSGCDNNENYDDDWDNNGCDENEDYNNDDHYDMHWVNNEDYYNNDYGNNDCDDDYLDDYLDWTDDGTMYIPHQMEWGPSNDVPEENLKAAERNTGSKTIDNAHEGDRYFGRG